MTNRTPGLPGSGGKARGRPWGSVTLRQELGREALIRAQGVGPAQGTGPLGRRAPSPAHPPCQGQPEHSSTARGRAREVPLLRVNTGP